MFEEKEVTTLEDMILEIDVFCDKSLSITHYAIGWEIHSFKEGTLFHSKELGAITAESLQEVVKKAWDIVHSVRMGRDLNTIKAMLKRQNNPSSLRKDLKEFSIS